MDRHDKLQNVNIPTKQLCILVPAPLWCLIFALTFCGGAEMVLFCCYLGQICNLFRAKLEL